MTMREDYDHNQEWNKLETPSAWHEPTFQPRKVNDWRELEFVTREEDGKIPLIYTFLAACGMWVIGFAAFYWWFKWL
jgi:hypothetical protein